MDESRTSKPSAGRVRATGEFLVIVLRSRSLLRRSMTGASVMLALAGIALLGYPFATNVYQGQLQERLETQLASPSTKTAYLAGTIEEGDGLTRLRIPATGVDVIVVEGTSASALRAGAGHYVNTPLPGEAGNVAIAGHRTTFGKPFADNDRLKPGDEILLDTPAGSYTYRVSKAPYVVGANDWQPIAQTPASTLTLTTCHPKGSAKQRLIVRAELVPAGPAPPPAS